MLNTEWDNKDSEWTTEGRRTPLARNIVACESRQRAVLLLQGSGLRVSGSGLVVQGLGFGRVGAPCACSSKDELGSQEQAFGRIGL